MSYKNGEIEFFKSIELKNYPHEFKLIDVDVEKCAECFDDDEIFVWTEYKGVYRDSVRNNTLHLTQIRFEGEETDDMDVIVNAISEEAYSYLMNELNTHKNVNVFLSQIYATTSDYVIVYDQYGEDCLYDEDYLKELMKKEIVNKYRFVKNGKIGIINL